MGMYRKKPVVVEAMQFQGGATNATPIIDWILAGDGTATWNEEFPGWVSPDGETGYGPEPEGISVTTLEGVMSASVGDFIIKGVVGEFYPCKPDIFEKTYTEINPTWVEQDDDE